MYEDTSPTFEINGSSTKELATLPLKPLQTQRTRQKYRMRNNDYESMRYECICSSQYFCYSSLYQHIKKNHKEFLAKNRHFAANNLIEIVDPQYGFKIRKILMEKIQFRSTQDLKKQQLRGEELRKIRLNEKDMENRLKIEYTEKTQIARERLGEINFENEDLDRKIKIVKQQIQKNAEVSQLNSEVISLYSRILGILKIKGSPQEEGDSNQQNDEM